MHWGFRRGRERHWDAAAVDTEDEKEEREVEEGEQEEGVGQAATGSLPRDSSSMDVQCAQRCPLPPFWTTESPSR